MEFWIKCLLLIIINPLDTAHGSSALNCYDWKGDEFQEGELFVPNGDDPCQKCSCDGGFPTACHSVACSPPPCFPYKAEKGKCCKFTCLDGGKETPGTVPKGQHPNVTHFERPTNINRGDAANMSLRLVASTVTTLLIIAIMVFMIHRLRQRRILIMMRRMQQEEEHTVAYVAGFNSVDIAMPPFDEPPPPYTPPKPTDLIISPLAPPSYEVVTAADNNNTLIAENGTTVHENGNIGNGHVTSEVQNQGTSASQSPARNIDQSGAAAMFVPADTTSTSNLRSHRHSYIAPGVHGKKRCKHAAKKKRHSVGNQTESIHCHVNPYVMSASFTQGVTEREVTQTNHDEERHTLPKHLSNKGVSVQSREQDIASANEVSSEAHVIRNSANETYSVPHFTIKTETLPKLEECERQEFENYEPQCICTENLTQKRYLKRSDSVEIEFDSSSPRHSYQNNENARQNYRQSYACDEDIKNAQGACNVQAKIKQFERKQLRYNIPMHSLSFDSSVADYQVNANCVYVGSQSLHTMQEHGDNSSPTANSSNSENSRISLCSETGETRKSVHSNSESNWAPICNSKSQGDIEFSQSASHSTMLNINEEANSAEQQNVGNPSSVLNESSECLLNGPSENHQDFSKPELRRTKINDLISGDLENDSSPNQVCADNCVDSSLLDQRNQNYANTHSRSASFPGEQHDQHADTQSKCFNFTRKSKTEEPRNFCEKVKKLDRKRVESPETLRRVSMAYEPDNTYTKYGFLDNPNSIEAADVILRDKRIRMRNAEERKKAKADDA